MDFHFHFTTAKLFIFFLQKETSAFYSTALTMINVSLSCICQNQQLI